MKMNPVSYRDIAKVEVEPLHTVSGRKNRGRYWKGVKHKDLIDWVKLDHPLKEQYWLSEDGADMIALFTSEWKDHRPLVCGLMNSNAMRRSAQMLMGVEEDSIPIMLRRFRLAKHSRHFELVPEVKRAAKQFNLSAPYLTGVVEILQFTDVPPAQVVLSFARKRIISASRMAQIMDEHEPETAWEFLLATAKMNQRNALRLVDGTIRIVETMDETLRLRLWHLTRGEPESHTLQENAS